MIHKSRAYNIGEKSTVHALALTLAKGNWSCCDGFSVEDGRLLALNDTFFGTDGHEEYAILLRGADGGYRSVESLTCGYAGLPLKEIEDILTNILAGNHGSNTVHVESGPVVRVSSQAALLAALGIASEAEVAEEPSLAGEPRPTSGLSPYLAREMAQPAITVLTHGREGCAYCR